jgi:hypothetical protein
VNDQPPAEVRPSDALLRLAAQPYVAEILMVLGGGPQSLAAVRRATGAPHRVAVAAVRALAAHQALTREPEDGSWDAIDQERAGLRLTSTGRATIGALPDRDTRWAAFAMYPPFGE